MEVPLGELNGEAALSGTWRVGRDLMQSSSRPACYNNCRPLRYRELLQFADASALPFSSKEKVAVCL